MLEGQTSGQFEAFHRHVEHTHMHIQRTRALTHIKTHTCVSAHTHTHTRTHVRGTQMHAEVARCPGQLTFGLEEAVPGFKALVARCTTCGLLHIVA